MRLVPALALVTLLACGSSTPPPAAAPAAPTEPAGPAGILAPPFKAADLRAGLPVGTEIRLRITTPGQPTVIQHWTFTAADADGCTIHARTLAEDGTTVIADEGTGTSKWTEQLETHAHFPAALTTRTDASIDVPAGHFDTWLFEVRPAKPGEPTRRLHFARTLPGPPVWMQITKDTEVVMTMELVSRTSP